jgi:hypothetical protein
MVLWFESLSKKEPTYKSVGTIQTKSLPFKRNTFTYRKHTITRIFSGEKLPKNWLEYIHYCSTYT